MSGRGKRPPRVPYAEACEAARQAIGRYQAAVSDRHRVPPSYARVFLAVLKLTALYSKLEDRVTHAELAKHCGGLHPKTVSEALAWLGGAGVIRYRPGLSAEYSVVGLTGATESYIAPLVEQSNGVTYDSLAPDDGEAEGLPSTESYSTPPNGVICDSPTEKDHREGLPRRNLTPALKDREAVGPVRAGEQENRGGPESIAGELREVMRRAELAATGEAAVLAEVEAMKAEGVLIERDET